MTEYVTRAGWGAAERDWERTVPLDWSRVTKFVVHYSGAPGDAARTQTVRSIQRYSMETKGYSDIDYNELVRGSTVYEGRGDYVGGHTRYNNATSYGLCMIGNDAHVTDADKQSIRERYEYACGRAGRRLQMLGHQDAPGNVGTTDCPGGKLEAWIQAGMPWPANVPTIGDDMFCKHGDVDPPDGYRVKAMQRLVQHAGYDLTPVGGIDGEYGDGTALGLATVIGFGDGRNYGDLEYVALHTKAFGGGTRGEKGDKGDPGKTPTAVGLEIAGTVLTLPVTAVE